MDGVVSSDAQGVVTIEAPAGAPGAPPGVAPPRRSLPLTSAPLWSSAATFAVSPLRIAAYMASAGSGASPQTSTDPTSGTTD